MSFFCQKCLLLYSIIEIWRSFLAHMASSSKILKVQKFSNLSKVSWPEKIGNIYFWNQFYYEYLVVRWKIEGLYWLLGPISCKFFKVLHSVFPEVNSFPWLLQNAKQGKLCCFLPLWSASTKANQFQLQGWNLSFLNRSVPEFGHLLFA